MLYTWWKRLSPLPGGRWLFSRLVGLMAPYTGTTKAVVMDLEPGRCRIQLKDRWRVRNHLSCVHALALANVGEMSTGLAVFASIQPDTRFIISGLSIEFIKKARGTLFAEARCPVFTSNEKKDIQVESLITDSTGTVVSKFTVRCLLGPKK